MSTPDQGEEEEMEAPPQASPTKDHNFTAALGRGLLLLNCTLMLLGSAGPLLLRVYFLHGGKRMWLSSFVQIGAWPLVLVPMSISYLHRRRRLAAGRRETKLFSVTPTLAAACAVLGILTGLDSYMFAFGPSYLPVSTGVLLFSTQVAFVALFALVIVRQRFTPYSINSVVLLTLGAVILGVRSAGDRPATESKSQYLLGFAMTIAAAALYGFTLPLTEMVIMRARQKITYSLVMEMQMVVSAFGSTFCIVGMLVNKDFQAMPGEAREFGLGETKYYVVLLLGALSWQLFNLGLIGTISCSSSLFAGVVVALILPASEIIAVLFFHEKFDGGKGMALALSIWGFVSYLYGELKQIEKMKQQAVVEVKLPVP